MLFRRFFVVAVSVILATTVHAEEEDQVAPDLQELALEWTEEMDTQARKDFDEMDGDKDGLVTEAEVWAYVGDDEGMKDEVANFLEKADSDKDGKINFDDYRGFVQALLAEYQQQAGGMPEGTDDFDFSHFEDLEDDLEDEEL
jgi:polyhydroxyalkanoate synthesis regulator phasin